MHDSGALDIPPNIPTPMTEELIAAAIAGVVSSARAEGQSLADLIRLVLGEDSELDRMTRQWLSEIVVEVWQEFPEVAFLQAA
ncbi:MAG: hypothetical protein HC852_19290 [Acaryochloridaceae cyanobacterium RU_4_10]|nr:hypothetical protein [Acaryochloridaceae cyanobacterium RU_4_10]